MNVQNFSFNPFTLSTARSTWQDPANSSLIKICKTTTAALYDIYVKNPYDLTIGNCMTLIRSTETQSTKIKLAVAAAVAFGSLYTLMLYGTTFHLQGRCLLALGSKSGIATLAKVGDAVKKLGTNFFVAGAVPIYGLFYALPKHIILSLPKIAHFVAAKIAFIAKWMFQNVLQPFWDKIMVPAARVITKTFSFVAAKIGVALKAIGNTIATMSKMVFKYVLKPFWEKALLPVLQSIGHAVHAIASTLGSALKSVGIKIAHTVQWVFQHVIIPFWKNIIVPVIDGIGHGIVYLTKGIGHMISSAADKVAQSAQLIFQHLIVPMWNKLVFPILKTVGHVVSFAAKMVAQSIQTLAHATAKVASLIFQKLIIPVFKGIANVLLTTGKLLGNYVVKPLISALASVAEKVGYLFKAVFDGLIVPIAKGATNVVSTLKNGVFDLSTDIWQTITAVWKQVALRFQRL
jgi:hypothetical protein